MDIRSMNIFAAVELDLQNLTPLRAKLDQDSELKKRPHVQYGRSGYRQQGLPCVLSVQWGHSPRQYHQAVNER